jgi:hypothetical protein
MEAIDPLVAPLIRDSYVQIAPNLRIAGRRLYRGQTATFDVPIGGKYALYSETGEPVPGTVEIDGKALNSPFNLARGPTTVTMGAGPNTALLLPQGSYVGAVQAGRDNDQLFAHVYD